MAPGSTTFRLAHALAAGLAGAARYALVLVLTLVLAVPALRLATDWYVRGRPDSRPYAPAAASATYRDIRVEGASGSEAQAVRDAVAGMRYRVDPEALRFVVVDAGATCVACAAEYVPYLALVRVQRRIVKLGGPALSWTVAHEIGHYVDDRLMTPAARKEYRRLRGISSGPSWTGGAGTEWRSRPDEDFAEVFAATAEPSIGVDPATEWGPVGDTGPYERLLASVGVRLGSEAPRAGWQETLTRDFALFIETARTPPIRDPLRVMLAVYFALGVLPPAARAWSDSAYDEGVPLDRNVRPVLNKAGHTAHIAGRRDVANQGPDHGSGR